MSEPVSKTTKFVFLIIVLLTLVLLVHNFHTFYLQKDYQFLVETSCGEGETCFVRDCSSTDECPPSELETYRLFSIKASDFSKCVGGDCHNQCLDGSVDCREVRCDVEAGETCQIPIE